MSSKFFFWIKGEMHLHVTFEMLVLLLGCTDFLIQGNKADKPELSMMGGWTGHIHLQKMRVQEEPLLQFWSMSSV